MYIYIQNIYVYIYIQKDSAIDYMYVTLSFILFCNLQIYKCIFFFRKYEQRKTIAVRNTQLSTIYTVIVFYAFYWRFVFMYKFFDKYWLLAWNMQSEKTKSLLLNILILNTIENELKKMKYHKYNLAGWSVHQNQTLPDFFKKIDEINKSVIPATKINQKKNWKQSYRFIIFYIEITFPLILKSIVSRSHILYQKYENVTKKEEEINKKV